MEMKEMETSQLVCKLARQNEGTEAFHANTLYHFYGER